jgi:DNA polymerase I
MSQKMTQQTNPANQPNENNPACIKCGLWKTCKSPFMDASGPRDSTVLIIGEAPGKDEDSEGRPFVGDAGTLLRPVVEEVYGEAIYTNIVRCRPPDNKITKAAINCCTQFALQDILEYDPETILLMGNVPLGGVLGETGITAWHGVTIERDGRRIIPILHPAYILRNRGLLDSWITAVANALEGGEITRGKFKQIIPKTLKQVLAMADALAASEYIAFDTEVCKLDAFHKDNKLLSVSFAIEGIGWSLPVNHKESWWTSEERDTIIGIISSILKKHDGYVLAQNAKFDQMQIFALLGEWFDIGGDTMLISHLLDSRKGIHGLKHLAGIHLGMYDYARPLEDYKRAHRREADPQYGGSYDNVPLDILLPYGGLDSEAVWRLHPVLYEKLTDKQRILYDQLILGVSDALAIMQSNGMSLDTWIAERYTVIYRMVQAKLYQKILADPKVRRMSKSRQKNTKKPYQFNPRSFAQKGELYYDYYRIPSDSLPLTKGQKVTTSAKILRPLEDDYPILHTIRYHNLLGQVISTYLQPAATGKWLSGDGKARTTFNLIGTITGRLSASDPFNSQNIPVPEKEPGTVLENLPVKNIFVHDYVDYSPGLSFEQKYGNGLIMVADLKGIELRVFASVANCEDMLEIHRSNKDFHSMVAVLSTMHIPVYDVTDADIKKISRGVRRKFKATSFGLFYGGDAYTLSKNLNISMDEAEDIVDSYLETFPRVKEFQDECVEFAQEHGYIETVFGRRAWLPYVCDNSSEGRHARREAMNIPIQSPAGDTLLCSLYIMQQRLKSEYGGHAHMINSVHDSLVLSLPVGEMENAAALLQDTMVNVPEHAKSYVPDLDFSWLRCPLGVDIEVGSHYGALTSIEKYREKHG